MPDVFHSKYRELTEGEKMLMEGLKNKALELYELFDQVLAIRNPDSVSSAPLNAGREIAISKTKLEESVMWAVKGLTK